MSRHTLINKDFCYVIPFDSGFAPNPFHGLLTLATCKPQIRLGVAKRILSSYYPAGVFNWEEVAVIHKAMPDREFIKNQGFWVFGIAGKDICNQIQKGSNGRILFMMQVTGLMTYKEYWLSHPEKRPTLMPKASVEQFPKEADYAHLGDNVYTGDWNQPPLYSPHYEHGKETMQNTINLIRKDQSGLYVLVSDNFAYFGKDALENPLMVSLATTQGHTVYEKGIRKQHPLMPVDDDMLLEELEEALSNKFDLTNLPGRVGFPSEWRRY